MLFSRVAVHRDWLYARDRSGNDVHNGVELMYLRQQETRTFETLALVGNDARKSRKRYALKIVSHIRQRAIDAISYALPEDLKAWIYEKGKEDMEWWGRYGSESLTVAHAGLRKEGINSNMLGVDNLDDYLIGLVEMAVGLTDQTPETPSTEDITTGMVGRTRG